MVEYFKAGSTQVFGRTVAQTSTPFTDILYPVIVAPPSNVEAPHETVNLAIVSASAVSRLGAPGAVLGVCIAEAVFALVEVEARSVTVTTLNSKGAGPDEELGAGALGAG
jgi:hypothetical protein